MLSSMMVNLVRLFMFLMEAFFISAEPQPETSEGKDSDPFNNGDDDDDEHFNNNGDKEAVLDAAFKYFEIDNPKEATREVVKKKFRRLSLVHHPDRNNQSEESVKEMQKINRYYELLEQEFDRREGKDGHDGAPDTPEEPTAQDAEKDPDEPGISPEEQKRRRNVQKKRRRKARKRARQEQKRQQEEYEKRRKEMEKEMQREWEEAKKKKREFTKQQKKANHENRGKSRKASLDTTWGRHRAHATWKSEIKAIIETRNDDTNTAAAAAAGHPQERVKNKKPSNPIMDCCTDDIAIALRLGATDVAIELIHDSMQEFMERSIIKMIYQKMMNRMPPNLAEEDRRELFHKAFNIVLTRPMDNDGNNALFYAVYYEDNELFSYLTNQARRLGYFAEYITSTNHYGSTVLDFCVGSSVPTLVSKADWRHFTRRDSRRCRKWNKPRPEKLISLYCYSTTSSNSDSMPTLNQPCSLLVELCWESISFVSDGTRR